MKACCSAARAWEKFQEYERAVELYTHATKFLADVDSMNGEKDEKANAIIGEGFSALRGIFTIEQDGANSAEIAQRLCSFATRVSAGQIIDTMHLFSRKASQNGDIKLCDFALQMHDISTFEREKRQRDFKSQRQGYM